jgi:hypothetical protein
MDRVRPRASEFVRPAAPFRDTPADARLLTALAPYVRPSSRWGCPASRSMRPRICPKRVLVKWLSASCRTKYGACWIRPPVLRRRCWRLVRDQLWMARGRTSRRRRLPRRIRRSWSSTGASISLPLRVRQIRVLSRHAFGGCLKVISRGCQEVRNRGTSGILRREAESVGFVAEPCCLRWQKIDGESHGGSVPWRREWSTFTCTTVTTACPTFTPSMAGRRPHGLRLLEGRLPQRALALVRTWGRLHREDLERDWELARANRPLRRIEPLE